MIKNILVHPEAIEGEVVEPFIVHPYVKPGDAYLMREDGTAIRTTIAKINELLEPLRKKLEGYEE